MDDLERTQQNEQIAGSSASETEPKPSNRRLTDHIVILFLLTTALVMLGQLLGMPVEALYYLIPSDFVYTVVMYLKFIRIWVLVLLYLRFTKKNRPILKAVGTAASGNRIKNLLLGIAVGFGLNGICIMAAWLHGDITLRYAAFQPILLIAIFIAVFIQSSAEELVCRGFLYQRLRRSYQNQAVAIVGNSMLFVLLHLFNDGVTILSLINIFVVGILFSLMVYYLDSLWCAMAAHAAWNFTQNIIFGLPNSGVVVPYSVFRLDAAAAKNSFAYNVSFGIEGTLLANAVLILACGCLYLWGRSHRSGSAPDPDKVS